MEGGPKREGLFSNWSSGPPEAGLWGVVVKRGSKTVWGGMPRNKFADGQKANGILSETPKGNKSGCNPNPSDSIPNSVRVSSGRLTPIRATHVNYFLPTNHPKLDSVLSEIGFEKSHESILILIGPGRSRAVIFSRDKIIING